MTDLHHDWATDKASSHPAPLLEIGRFQGSLLFNLLCRSDEAVQTTDIFTTVVFMVTIL